MADKITPEALAEVRAALKEYTIEVFDARDQGHLHGNTSETYLRRAESFVRWLSGEYEPGTRSKNRAVSRMR